MPRNLVKYRKWRKERYWRWRLNECCIACGSPSGSFHMCLKHRVYQSKWKRKNREKGLYK